MAVVLVALVAGGLGAFAAMREGDDGSRSLAGVGAGAAAAGPNGEPQVIAADPAVEFPPALGALPNPPSHLAVDPETGDLWFLVFTYDGKSNTLYHYAPAHGKVETFEIPSSHGSELYSAIAVDSRGHVISAEGIVVTDFDPSTGDLAQVKLPEPVTKAVAYSPSDGPWVLDMAVGPSGLAYLSRMNVPAITELNVTTGESRELPYRPDFGPAYGIELGSDGLIMTSVWNIAGLSTAQTGRIDVTTGEFIVIGPATTAIAAGLDRAVFGVRAPSVEVPTPDLVRVSAAGLTTVPVASESQRARLLQGLGLRDFLAVDPTGGDTWVTGEGSGSISRLTPDSVRSYELPIYQGAVWSCPHPCSGSAGGGDLRTAVRGLAVAPNGDLYFSDATLSRIGVIRAGR